MNSQRLYYEVLKEYFFTIQKCFVFKDYFYFRKTRFNKTKTLVDYDTYLAFNLSTQRIKEELLYLHLLLIKNNQKSPCKLIIERIEEDEEEYAII